VTVPFLDLGRRVATMRPQLDGAIADVLDGGRFVLGPAVEEFEKAFATFCGASHAIGVASGTDALAIALQAVGVAAGDEVITVANTCVPTVSAIESFGARPVLVDPEPTTYTLDPATLEAACGERTKAIVPVHLYGQCADVDAITSFARTHGLQVVEDAAQAHGAAFRGRRAGTLGDAAAFSFYPTKNLGALGDGGAVVTNDPDVAACARLLRNYGESERYRSVAHGVNSRLDTLQASVLSTSLQHLDRWNDRRRDLAAFYKQQLADAPLVLPAEGIDRHHVYHLFVVLVADRDDFRAALDARGVGTLIHYPVAIHEHPAYHALSRDGALETSERLAREVVSLPLYPELTDAEAEAVVEAVKQAAHAPPKANARTGSARA
jgi:dTDP-4-amino-4,6-dideoxygalactose transaminase